jgi:hypothetical protein
MAIATEWKVEQAGEIICDVTKAVRTFSTTAKKLAVQGGKSLDDISADIRMRLDTIGNKLS